MVPQKTFFLLGLAVLLTGCATTKSPQLTQQLQMRIGELERQLSQRDEEINELKYEIKDIAYEIDRMNSSKMRRVERTSSALTAVSAGKDEKNLIRIDIGYDKVQSALKKAGYYNGPIDSKIGAKTQKAIAKFQGDHGLKGDGIVGKKTWMELRTYLK
ncbi:MAG: peptidoglycan-binding protein [Candidatus Omnitrophica bacterium]|nr:peptidoglycan-binding protein [Candidatus Omnitrophota bacterium]